MVAKWGVETNKMKKPELLAIVTENIGLGKRFEDEDALYKWIVWQIPEPSQLLLENGTLSIEN